MANENKQLPSEKFLETLFELALVLSAIVALYALIWANWPVFKLAATIFVTIVLGFAIAIQITDRIRKKD